MSSELVTIAGTLSAALLAGVISYFAGRGMKTHEWRLALAKEELASRKSLYAAFLAEAQRLVIQASDKKFSDAATLNTLSGQYAEITLVGSAEVIEAAIHLFDSVILANVRDETAAEAMEFHPRKEAFLKAARNELQSYRTA
jgi:hypothetical protein